MFQVLFKLFMSQITLPINVMIIVYVMDFIIVNTGIILTLYHRI